MVHFRSLHQTPFINQKVAHWVQVIGNFGIVASLVFVCLKINQDRELKKIELMWASFDRVRAQHLLGENSHVTATKGAIRPDELGILFILVAR